MVYNGGVRIQEDNMENDKVTVEEKDYRKALDVLAKRSCWFSVTPLPDGFYEIEVKPSEGHAGAVLLALK